ncbi:MAG: glycosyltransferase [Microscillaceae bacterium]|nr:glycosyltransferase [Microscillaceae bacterium]
MEVRTLYSIIIPLYNRPDEIKELLESLTQQTYPNFEVIIVEDGSKKDAKAIVDSFREQLDVHYYYKENSGQGFSRNYGFERAQGDYFIVFDSDCIIPPDYLEIVHREIHSRKLDAFGGPDKAHPSFTLIQKAISYAMTSQISTGGIRGSKRAGEKFRPRSFNMGISRQVYEEVGGFIITRMGEDIEYSIRIEKHFFKVGLIREAFVYHKRRTNFRQFYKQLHFFGRARINVNRFHPGAIKWVHTLPALFVIYCATMLGSWLIDWNFFLFQAGVLTLYTSLVFSDALARTKSLYVGFLGVGAVFVQIFAYGIGFLSELMRYSKVPELTRK